MILTSKEEAEKIVTLEDAVRYIKATLDAAAA